MQISTLFVGKTDAPSHAHFRESAEGYSFVGYLSGKPCF